MANNSKHPYIRQHLEHIDIILSALTAMDNTLPPLLAREIHAALIRNHRILELHDSKMQQDAEIQQIRRFDH